MPRVNQSSRNPTLEPIMRSSTTQPQYLSSGSRRGQDWDSSCPAGGKVMMEYSAITDPYCPYTRTKAFKKHMKRQQKLEKIPAEKLSKSLGAGLQTSMNTSSRPTSAPQRKNAPKHQSENFLSSGVTISSEAQGSAAESQAELEVLKAILNREGYLSRLSKVVKKVDKKFKPEIADVLDMIRIATTDVVDAIENWRNIKNDPDCAFMWNGINYLLKIPTDMDYIDRCKVITDWLGFGISRNPFCVPYPMEEGAELFSGSLMATSEGPSEQMSVSTTDGFVIGGSKSFSSSSKLRNKFPRASRQGGEEYASASVGSPYKRGSGDISGYTPSTYGGGAALAGSTSKGAVQSFIPNKEMVRIRNAERVILVEEDKFGRLDRDPEGRIIHNSQEFAMPMSVSQRGDELSGAGLDNEVDLSDGDVDALDKVTQRPITGNKERSVRAVDGGMITSGVSQSRVSHLPTRSHEVNTKNSNRKKTVGDRLAEITALKEKIAMEKSLLEKSQQQLDELNGVKVVKPKKGRVQSKTAKNIDGKGTLVESVANEDEVKEDRDEVDNVKSSSDYGKEIYIVEEIEHKTLQNEESDARNSPQKDVHFDPYDLYATKAQTQVRKWLAQRFVTHYRKAANEASNVIQTRVRGMCARLRCRKLMRQKRAAIEIQRHFRGMSSRLASAAVARNYHDCKAAIKIQKIWRRILALNRVETKKILDDCAADAMECVNARNLFPMDVKELSIRIQLALSEPHNVTLPPDEVLHLLRMSSILLAAGEGVSNLTSTDQGVSTSSPTQDSRNMSWQQAMKLVNRSNKFLRRIRALAYAPIAKPPRLINLPDDAIALYKAQGRNPKWCLSYFESIGKGSKFCAQLFKWLVSMIQVGQAQTKFFEYIGDKFPDWLPKLFEVQKQARKCEFDIALNNRSIALIIQTIEVTPDDGNLKLILEKEKQALVKENEGLDCKLQSYTKREKIICDDQNDVETSTLDTMTAKLDMKENSLRETAQEYLSLIKLTEEGDMSAESKLQPTREKLTALRSEVQDARIQHGLLVAQVDSNRKRRRNRKPISANVLVKVNLAGEAKALLTLATAKKAVLLLDRGIHSEDGLHRNPDAAAIYDDLCYQERQRKTEFRSLLRQADEELQVLNNSFTSGIFKREEDERNERAKFVPTEAELEEERMEDEREAREERFANQNFVPHEVMYDAPDRLRPVILAFGRDVPGFTKDKIISDVTAQLPGMFIQLDCDGNMGLDRNEMQGVLDAKKSIIISVDHGLTQTSRVAFMKAYSTVVRCLVPKPYTIFVLGEDGNARKANGDQRFGVSVKDIQHLHDAPIKLSLEKMAWILQELVTDDIRQRMELRAAMIVPPSPAYIICLEALFIAQSDHTRFQQPEDNIAAISYRATQALLQDPHRLVALLQQMGRGKADEKLCDILKNYTAHRSWPYPSHPERQSDPLLNLLATYVEEWTNSEVMTLERGGIPDSGLFKNSMERVQSVVTIADVTDANDELAAKKRSGWKTPMTQILKGILYEMRVAKTVRKIEKYMYSINVYREAGRIFFDAYDASTSQSYVTSVSLFEVPSLLVPNALTSDMSKESESVSPPMTPKEMYMRLVKLLRFQKASKLRSSRKELLCRRENRFMSHQVTKLCGHSVMLKCFEAALGELYFEAYLPEYSAKLTLQVEDTLRLKMLANCDQQLEHRMLESDYSVDLLPYVLDRLRVTPTKPVTDSRKEKVTTTSALSQKTSNQGFSLVLNCKAGPGRFLTKKILSFAGIPYLLALRSSAVSQTLRIIAYEPRTQATSELRLTSFSRVLLLGAVNDDHNMWFPKLKKILRLDWKNKRELTIDKTLYRTVRRISKRRLILTFSLADENGLLFDFHDPFTGDHFSANVTKNHIIDLLHYDQNELLGESNTGKIGAVVSAVKDILRYMLGARRKANKAGTKAIDPSEYDIPLEDILSQKECLIHLANQMQQLVERLVPSDMRGGYVCRFPTEIVFERKDQSVNNTTHIVSNDESVITDASSATSRIPASCSGIESAVCDRGVDTKPKLDMVLRHTHRLVQLERGGSLADLIARRRQPKVVRMEDELDRLAESMAEAAKQRMIADKLAAEELHRKLVVDGDDLSSTNEAISKEILPDKSDIAPAASNADIALGPPKTLREEKIREERAPLKQRSEGEKSSKPNDDESSVPVSVEFEDSKLDESIVSGDYFEKETLGTSVSASPRDMFASADDISVSPSLIDDHVKVPSTRQQKFLESVKCRPPQSLSPEEVEKVLKEIKVRGEICVFERGVKTNFREGTSRWHGHVSTTVYEAACWDNIEGVGRSFRFVVYETRTACYYEGVVRSTKHLREVLGPTAQHLLHAEKTKEMVLFICRNRLEVVRNTTTWDGVPVEDPMAPAYRIEFKTDRLYTDEKITPAYVGGEADAEANKDKLIDNVEARGRKILRIAKRISGLLLQLVVFELPSGDVEKAKAAEEEAKKRETEGKEGNTSKASNPPRVATKKRANMEQYISPPIRVVGYDPRTKKRSVLFIPPEAVMEVAGGAYSQYLEFDRRRELGKLICDALQLNFPRGGGFDMIVPWSKATKESMGAVASDKTSWRSSAERILRRPGKIFRSAISITGYNIIVSVYATGIGSDGAVGDDKTVVVNFYSSLASEATEIRLPENIQVEYLGQPVMNYPSGEDRSTAIRNMCKYFRVDIYDDPDVDSRRILDVEMLPHGNSSKPDSRLSGAEDDIGTQGFLPPESTGKLLFRRNTQVYVVEKGGLSDVEFLVSLYTKTEQEGAERGIVVKVYDPKISVTFFQDYGHNEIIALCNQADEPDLLRDIVTTRDYVCGEADDTLEEGLVTPSEKEESQEKMNELISILCDIVTKDIGMTTNSQGERSLCSRSSVFEPS